MGTPDFSVPTLRALDEAGHDIVACYTQPPRPAGRRGLEHVPSPVQKAAEELGIPVFSPVSLKSEEEVDRFKSHDADVAVVVAYGVILTQDILDAPRHGCYNGHASLLPRWRGAAPIQRAIMAGDDETGMMVMKMERGLDSGPIALSANASITLTTTTGTLHDTLADLGAKLMVQAMEKLEAGTLSLTPQSNDGVVYASKISKEESRLDWSESAQSLQRKVMGLSPSPGAWCEMGLGGKSTRVKVLAARLDENASGLAGTVLDDQLTIACGDGAVRLLRLQKAGSKVMDAAEFLRGNALPVGTVLN